VPRPNLVFILSDQHRYDFLGCDPTHPDGPAITPHLDGLAAGGTLLLGMHSTSPLCMPQRASLAAGRYCFNTGCFTNRHELPEETPTFAGQLQAAGYATAAIGKLHHRIHGFGHDFVRDEAQLRRLGWDTLHQVAGKTAAGQMEVACNYTRFLEAEGLLETYRQDYGALRGRRPGRSRPWEASPTPLPEEATQDGYVTRKAVVWLANQPAERPYFLYVGLVGPHPPLDPLPHYAALYNPERMPPPLPGERELACSTRQAQEMRAAYCALISQVDAGVGQLLAAVDRRPDAGNTLVLYSSDHGEMAGDHGLWQKSNFYQASLRVPFIARGPGIPAGRRVTTLAELIDIGKTLCDFGAAPPHHWDQGQSMKPVLTGETEAHRADAFAEMGCDKFFRTERHVLMYGDPTRSPRDLGSPSFGKSVSLPPSPPRLFDLLTDPDQQRDLSEDAPSADLLAEMKERLLVRLITSMQARPDTPGGV